MHADAELVVRLAVFVFILSRERELAADIRASLAALNAADECVSPVRFWSPSPTSRVVLLGGAGQGQLG